MVDIDVKTVILDIDETIPGNDKRSKKWSIAAGRKAYVLGINCTSNSGLLVRIKHKGHAEYREWKGSMFNTSPEKMMPLYFVFGTGDLELEVANTTGSGIATTAGLLVADCPEDVDVTQILELYR